MKKIYMSAIAATLLSTSLMAESSSIKDALSNGKTTGDVTIYTESMDKAKDTGYTMSSIGLAYETDSLNGFKGALAFRSNHKISEKENGNYSNGTDPEVALSTANISYSTDKATIVVGRQAIDLEWIGDYHEAVVGVLTYVPNTTIVVAHTERNMVVDADAALGKMADIGTNSNGASVIDVKYDGIANTTINPYFMNASDLFSAYGLKATTSISNINVTAHYAATSEDVAGKKDGSIAHLEVGTTVSDVALTAGYITAGKDNGAGSLNALGDNIDPFENGGKSYGADSDTFYVSAAADISTVSLSAFYGSSSYGSSTDSEIILTAGTTVAENLSLNLLVASTSNEVSTTDTDEVSLTVAYSF